jgi:cystathionine beta-lyase/cystathionine gamma-synthase
MTTLLRSPKLEVANDDRVGLFDLQRQRARLESDLKARIEAVLMHGQFILGPEVETLEKRLADYTGAPHVVAVSSGRDALMIALMAMGVKPGDAVFVPAFTFAATAGAVASIGASPGRRCRSGDLRHGPGRPARHRRGQGGGPLKPR